MSDQAFPVWRKHQRDAGHNDNIARFLIVTCGDYNLVAALREALDTAHDELDLEEPDDARATQLVKVEWSCLLSEAQADGILARTLYRVALLPDDPGWEDFGNDGNSHNRGDSLVTAFASALSALQRGNNTTPGIDHTLKLHDPQRGSHYADLYREISAIEMAVRECLTVIFLRAYSDRPYTFLDRTKALILPKDEKPTAEDLANRQENELFHILFSDYPILNDPTDVKVQGLVQKIREALSFEALKDALAAFPIANDDDSGFIAALKGLLEPIERIRNPVAHSRVIPKRAWENYENSRERIWERIAQFWAKQKNGEDGNSS